MNLEFGNALRDPRDLLSSQQGHLLVVFRVVADVAGVFLFLKPAKAMRGTRGSRYGPGTCQSLGIALIRQEALRISSILNLDSGKIFNLRDTPWLGAIGQVAIGEIHDRDHVLCSDPDGLDRHGKAIGG